ncbi:MAG: NYN domain-containing protein, partial [Gemmatimonadota bacterium]|nr:NYN domain-containing protein [Gemmatimonadota bacterium]
MHPRSSRSASAHPVRAAVAPLHRGPQAMTAGANAHAPNAALLIDFDNVTMGIRSDLQTELRNLLSSAIISGKVAVQRAYADWRRYPQYIVPLSESSIDLIFAPAYGSSKKNATDIRLAVDAVELVFTRPEIGTYILLSGDSDFSSLVLKLKEYGKYVIGVGIRESSSDLLVQNCDEYYSYNALAGLMKTGDETGAKKWDPWELVTEAVTRMQKNGDVMRSDRLKQVMQEIDAQFDEKDLGMSKFSRFCMEAAQKGLLAVTKLENGQLEVAPATKKGDESPAKPASGGAERAEGE